MYFLQIIYIVQIVVFWVVTLWHFCLDDGSSMFLWNLAVTCKTAWCHDPEDDSLNIHSHENLKSHNNVHCVYAGTSETFIYGDLFLWYECQHSKPFLIHCRVSFTTHMPFSRINIWKFLGTRFCKTVYCRVTKFRNWKTWHLYE